jgi:hypothetical protein
VRRCSQVIVRYRSAQGGSLGVTKQIQALCASCRGMWETRRSPHFSSRSLILLLGGFISLRDGSGTLVDALANRWSGVKITTHPLNHAILSVLHSWITFRTIRRVGGNEALSVNCLHTHQYKFGSIFTFLRRFFELKEPYFSFQCMELYFAP